MEDQIWLNISLFCKRNNWGRLLRYGITPFVKSLIAQRSAIDYIIELCLFEGDNVRLAILVEEHNMLFVGETTDNYFKNFFKHEGFDRPNVSMPINGLFLPFPCNSIRYGLYSVFSEFQNRAFVEIQREISNIICLVCFDEIIDDELLITLGFYLQSMWIVRKKKNILFSDNWMEFRCSLKKDAPGGKLLETEIHQRYLLTKEMLAQIFQDILDEGDQRCDHYPFWLQQWSRSCDRYLDSVNETNCEIPAMISRCLGLTPVMNFMVLYFLQQVLLNLDGNDVV